MFKKVLFNVILNLIIICSAIGAVMAFKAGNYFLPLLLIAAFGLSLYYKIKLMKQVREEMKLKAEEKLKNKNPKKRS
ncbi:DUF6358 family protein [Pedobacter glucosidilyticus]|uniref:DUF6358 family protein n=1 Tax=Pedobacter glucosidilyticus TaxID=1122941 RepID=UPI0026EFCF14|nr:DUF6358 family protein [Pedobacter glucosidilyticus]